MRLQFKHQKFQADAARAVVDVFSGQPYLMASYGEKMDFAGWRNEPVVPELSDEIILEHVNQVQKTNGIAPSPRLEGRYNLTIEMETGVGKTYTYIKTMYELNRHYGWNKFIVVVPSIAVREGVCQSFRTTEEHFAEEYGKKIRWWKYNSAQLTEVDRFASDCSMNVMIINAQAFNARGKDARRIYMKLDEFRFRRPIDIIARTNPILIIDEPQSVEGKQTKERLKEFHPLLTLRYSATHRSDSIYNMVYRLGAAEAYRERLVKKVAVKGITESGNTESDGYVYLESVNLSKAAPTVTIQFDVKGTAGIRRKTMTAGIGFDLYKHSNGMEEYKEGYVLKSIDGRDNHIEFLNGIRLYAGDVIGKVSEDQIRRIQIRETILSHLEREQQLFKKGIKVLSLFFIDEVARYRQYDEAGCPQNGIYADIFEEEYTDIVSALEREPGDDAYLRYLRSITAHETHAGYFSVDKKGKMMDSKLSNKKERISDDVDAYDLIMRDKELLLERDPKKSPVRFIFSHSALREGWDNPNVFQICTLKQSGSDVRKRQEVGRGLRLCVNQDGERMDVHVLGNDVHNVNVLTVIASESYESFVRGLQTELADASADCFGEKGRAILPENARSINVKLQIDKDRMAMPEFRELWSRIRKKSVYTVDFDTDELVQKAAASLDRSLHVAEIHFQVETGIVGAISSERDHVPRFSFEKEMSFTYRVTGQKKTNVKYDLVGKLVEETGLTRKTVIRILQRIRPQVFSQFKENPEEFILRAAAIINGEKAEAVIQHVAYRALEQSYGTEVLTDCKIGGKLGINAVKTAKHLYDYVIYKSEKEKEFAAELDENKNVAVYVKLPDGFYISTPAGHYHPGWAIAFYKGAAKHVYFVAEIKAASSVQERQVEKAMIHCAREHFKAISGGEVVYDVVDTGRTLIEQVLR